MTGISLPSLNARPERIFVSVDKSTGRSTISFAPSEAGSPVLQEDDRTGALAMRAAKAISERYPGCTIHGPHFHAAHRPGRKRVFRKPSNQATEDE